jgi:hypothetical protein
MASEKPCPRLLVDTGVASRKPRAKVVAAPHAGLSPGYFGGNLSLSWHGWCILSFITM